MIYSYTKVMNMKKKVCIGLIVILFLVIILAITFMLFLEKRDNEISLIKDNVVIEYGNAYNPEVDELIDLSKYNFINQQEIRIETNIENEKDKDYPKVGEYEINVYYKKKILKQKIEVKDTTAPELSVKDNIEIPFGTDLSTFDFKNYIVASDLSELKDYAIDLSKIDSNASGEYETVVAIEDIYGNKTEKNIKIKILEKMEEKTEKKDNTTPKQSSSKNEVSNSKPITNSNPTKETEKNNNNNNNSIINNDTKKEETEETPKCNHSSSNWFNSEKEAIATYDKKVKEWGDKWSNGIISYEQYIKNCPSGYETWDCPICHKWTINMYSKN